MNDFSERYNKFKKNNLPTPFWDEERQTFEYVYFYNGKSIINFEESKDQLEVSTNLTDALAEIATTGFYYSFTSKYIEAWQENGKIVRKITVGHSHAHSFEEVVRALYASPESFSISKKEEEFYSKQELEYLKRVQKYLLFIGMKDLETRKAPVSRYRNKRHSKYKNAIIYKYTNEEIEKIINGNLNFQVTKWYPEYSGNEKYKPKEYQALIVDKEHNFKMFLEFTKRELKKYQDIKSIYKIDDLNDDDNVIVTYFKILEIY